MIIDVFSRPPPVLTASLLGFLPAIFVLAPHAGAAAFVAAALFTIASAIAIALNRAARTQPDHPSLASTSLAASAIAVASGIAWLALVTPVALGAVAQ